jgi:disulfide bond formation protein DsbB
MPHDHASPLSLPASRLGGLLLLSATAVIVTALAFQHLGGYDPCPLCLQERYAYYAGIPLLFAALVLLLLHSPKGAAALFALVALTFIANAALGSYHAGVEWKFWAGPDTCAATARPLTTGPGGLLKQLETTRVIRCDEAPWHFLGLSFAGWNAVASLVLAAGAATAALKAWRA